MGRTKGSKNKPKESSETTQETPSVETNDTESEKPTGRPAHLDRGKLLKEINDSNKERAALEASEEEQTEHQQEETNKDDQEQETSDQTHQETQTEIDSPAQTTETPKETISPPAQKRKLIIDGVEKELTDEEIIALAQKAGAVDSRLAEATRVLQDAQRTAATLRGAQPNAAIPSQSGSQTEPPAGSGADVREMAQKLSKGLMFGSEQEVQEAVAYLLGSGRHTATQLQGLNPAQIQGLVSDAVAFERQKALLDIPADQGGYADVWSEPMLQAEFKRRVDQSLDSGKKYHEAFSESANEIRQWRNDLIKKHTPKTGLENRDQLKRATGIVRGGDSRLPTAPIESKPKNHDEVLDGMRRARGLS